MICKYCGFLLLFLASFGPLHAQYDNVWAFGRNAGIDFNTHPARAIVTGIEAGEGCASVCNDRGELLFYTNGYTVWNREHQPMPRGQNLPSTTGGYFTSSSQGTLIAALPDNPDRYYIFSLGSFENAYYFGRLYYSVVDMSLDNGLGDVVAGEKGILLDSMLTEHMSGVLGEDCGLWLLVLSRAKDEAKAFRIDHKGIARQPVISERIKGGGALNGGIGCMDVSANRRRIAVAQGNLVVYDFDPATGVLSRPVMVDNFPLGVSPGGYYGVAFSPDNTKLYANDVPFFYQFDLSLGNVDDIRTSKLKLSDTRFRNAAIKRGPDGKMYTATMSVIHEPDRAGSACRFEDRGLQLAAGTSSSWGLPNTNALLHYEQRHSIRYDTFHCVDEAVLRAGQTGMEDYVWDDGSTGTSRKVRSSGTYWVRYYDFSVGCIRHTDSFRVVLRPNVYHHTSTEKEGLCPQDTVRLQASLNLPLSYTWTDGVAGPQRRVHQPGLYILRYSNDTACSHYTDSFRVQYPAEPYRVSFTADSFVCLGAAVTLQNTSSPRFTGFLWFMGDGTLLEGRQPAYRYTDTGTYRVRLAGRLNAYCADTVDVVVTVDPRIGGGFTLSADSICQGQSVTAQSLTPGNTVRGRHWQWASETGADVIEGHIAGHAFADAGQFPVILTTRFRACPDTVYQRKLYVDPVPLVDLGPDTGLCAGSPGIVLSNKTEGEPGTRYLWNTGDTGRFVLARQPGRYSLSVWSAALGCLANGVIQVHKRCYLDIPNAFTPNGDGHNDFFLPRSQAGSGISSLNIQVLNRYGQLVFESQSLDGMGWDGRYLGRDQPEGVYPYIIDLTMESGHVERYVGGLTLVR